MDSYITRAEHEEFVKRMEGEHDRQNHRLLLLEKGVEENNKLLLSVEKLALNMENMQKELSDENERLEILENRDGEMWRKVTSHIVTAVVGAIIAFVFTQIGM